MTPDEQAQYARFYERIYGGYLDKQVETQLHFRLYHDPIAVIDLGCGTGQQLANIAEKNTHPESYFLGIDNNAGMIDRTRSLASSDKRLDFRQISFLATLDSEQHIPYRPGLGLYFTCLGNTLALVSHSEYHNISEFLAQTFREAGVNSAILFLEFRDSTEYRNWIGAGRLELLNYKVKEQESMLLSFQALETNPDEITYTVTIYSVCKAKNNAEFYFIKEPQAFFADIALFVTALSSHFKATCTEICSAKSGLTSGKMLEIKLDIK